MRKMAMIIFLCIISILIITGCTSEVQSNIGDISNIEIYNNDIMFYVKDDTLSNSGATFLIENNSDTILGYGESYHLEKYHNDSWHFLNTITDATFNVPLWSLNHDENTEITINWENFYGILDSGNYRIVKDVSFVDKEGTLENFYIGVEFTIE